MQDLQRSAKLRAAPLQSHGFRSGVSSYPMGYLGNFVGELRTLGIWFSLALLGYRHCSYSAQVLNQPQARHRFGAKNKHFRGIHSHFQRV
jgi:hypothetical protein